MYVDSHCHLNFPELAPRLPELLGEMRRSGVRGALCICTTMSEAAGVQRLAQDHPQLWASVGVHPDTEGEPEPSVETLCAAARQFKVVAIGETGLDYYRLNGRSVADMHWQRERFRLHIRAALQTGLPLVIHTRAAAADTLGVLREEQGARAGGVFHCFTETADVARQVLDMGFHVSISGIVTFRNAHDVRAVARMVPLERLLIETDSPYLAPVPLRGQTNHPALVRYVGEEIARLRGMEAAELARQTTRNFERLFNVKTFPVAEQPDVPTD